jgi:cysteine desulfurase/selenocysteine lyase
MSFDPAAFKKEFPIFAAWPELHYLDNAATGQTPFAVLNAVRDFEITSRANVQRGSHTLAERASEAYEGARASVARYLNAQEEEVIFTSGATAGLNLAAYALAEEMRPGDVVVLSQAEHHSALVPWLRLRESRGIELRFIPLSDDGRLDFSKLGELVDGKCRAICVTLASNVTGAVTNVAPLRAAAKSVGATFLLDAAQAAPHGPLDVKALGCDLLVLAGHKCFGPTGIGALWGRGELLNKLTPLLSGGGMIGHVSLSGASFAAPPRRFEAGTPPIAQAIGLGAALDWLAGQDWPSIHTHLQGLTQKAIEGLLSLPGLKIIGPTDMKDRLPVISFAMENMHPHDICQIADRFGVALRGGHHCAEPLMERFEVSGTTRASLAPYNDASDIEVFLEAIAEAGRILP